MTSEPLSAVQRYTLTPDPDDGAYMELDPEGRWCLFAEAARAQGRAEALDDLPVLRLTGEQLDRLDGADAFAVDWDEYDEFVRLDDVRAAIKENQP